MIETGEFLSTAVSAARLAGKMIVENLGKISGDDIRLKNTSDFVTRIDNESEHVVISTIKEHFPDHNILAEESLKG
jgi:myo-inositol-1(or 4)-monophosphatase